MSITGFDSIGDYFRFSAAREYWNTNREDGGFEYEKGWLERAGDFMIAPVHRTTDFGLRNLKNPLMITALTTAAAGLASLAYYPDETIAVVLAALPEGSTELLAAGFKFTAYLGFQDLILGVGARTMGRLSNSALMGAWKEKRIVPIAVGTVIETG